MSITFSTFSSHFDTKVESCLCSQMAPFWVAFMNGEIDESDAHLSEYADSNCPFCHGTGVESVRVPENGTHVNFCNDNAINLLGIVGLPREYTGRISVEELPAAIRGCIRALNSRTVRAPAVRVSSSSVSPSYTEAVIGDDGLAHIEVRGGCGWFDMGLDDGGVVGRLESLLSLFKLAQDRGHPVFWG